jgi:hypothetical protein
VKVSLSIIFFLLIVEVAFAQKRQSPNSEQLLNITIGSSFHGTGDMRGVIMNTEYSKNLKKRIGLSFSLGGTLHDGSIPVFFVAPTGQNIDGSVRYTAGGLQLTSHLGYSFIKTTYHQFQFRAGGLLRYQSSSYYSDVTILYPAGSGLPVPVIVFNNTTPQKTFSIGASAQLFYNYTISDKIALGLLAGFQTDTNGDVIRQLSLSVCRRF